jgi:hypothetical protein
MKRPSFSAVALESGRRDPETRSLELNLMDAKGNSQNVVLSPEAIAQVLASVFQKRMEDPTKDFFVDESIPLAGIGYFSLPEGHVGLRLYMNKYEVFDVSFAPEVQGTLHESFSYIANRSAPKSAGGN